MKTKQKWLTKDGYLVGIGDTIYGWYDARSATICAHKPDNKETDRVYVNNGKSNIFVRGWYYLKSNAFLDGILHIEKHCDDLKTQIKAHKKELAKRRKELLKALQEEV